ncbi:hypothetical protein HXX76_014932 [Chlamydomonas incerta]|uniref:magnesium chelatase n=1 Tax=Chlamydomonas incerta TaxID=51695 RepID=A0A835SAT5_CHLIN|nr:hypothetical protein HXX76_014932 [Chlamydomonas incerta]|eukprot:KAG2423878.1 hypothetical protein HXX76_014932 [Chlamydomonas incerta]
MLLSRTGVARERGAPSCNSHVATTIPIRPVLSHLASGPTSIAKLATGARSSRDGRRVVAGVASKDLTSEAEKFVATLETGAETEDDDLLDAGELAQLRGQLQTLRDEEARLTAAIDGLYDGAFAGVAAEVPALDAEGAEATGGSGATQRPMEIAADVDADAAAADAQQGSQQEGVEEEEGMERTERMVLTAPVTEAAFSLLGRDRPAAAAALMAAAEAARGGPAWHAFQSQARTLKLQRTRVSKEAAEVEAALGQAERAAAMRAAAATGVAGRGAAVPLAPAGGARVAAGGRAGGGGPRREVRIVLVSGFESFNVGLYKDAAELLKRSMPNVTLQVFSDRDLGSDSARARLEAALSRADIFFGSLLFDYDQVEWLRARLGRVPVRLVFESALELMSCNKVGSFAMGGGPGGGPPGKAPGPPAAVKKVLSMFGSGREEDKMVGYLSFLKLGPKLLKWVPGQKAADLRAWLTAYAYWNQGGAPNVVAMFSYLVEALLEPSGYVPPPVVETPALGCLHPAAPGRFFDSPADYMKWYAREGPLRGAGAPVVGVLLYRKHVITEQPYIPQLIAQLEAEGLLPVPIFINGVEAHTVVRDLLTSSHEQELLARGETGAISPTLKRDAVKVDAVVSTIGFPIVGGPAGTMEGGRQAEVAKAILGAKDVPYTVAAPLLIQDMESWSRDGVAGLQSVVLYSLPELDGAVDTVPLGGLVGDDIYLVPERVKKLAGRLKAWVGLRRKQPAQRKVAVLLYGFPPGVGATGTAALLNVPKSLENVLVSLRKAGYDLGPNVPEDLSGLGEALVTALKAQEDQRAISRGQPGMAALGGGPAAAWGAACGAGEMSPQRLKELLTYPAEWGPNEWGPLPFLPDADVLVGRMERQWGDLRAYRGLNTSARGLYQVPGLQLGNVWVGVQPPLGLEGDPMRLLFQRDLTPHPQYAAFYKWIQHEYGADVVLHFGMHGTVEWLPGAPLGNNGLSWSDVLLGELPNVYVYAANNPSESIVAKRRGYGTIVSHNVPPYGRAGLYKQLSSLKETLQEYREGAQAARARCGGEAASGAELAAALAPVVEGQAGLVIDGVKLAGLEADCPYTNAAGQVLPLPSPPATPEAAHAHDAASPSSAATAAYPSSAATAASPSSSAASSHAAASAPSWAGVVDPLEFDAYATRLYAYLQLLEGRLFSEGLHVLGAPPAPPQMLQYLEAYFGPGLPRAAVEAVAASGEAGAAAVRSRLERLLEEETGQSPFEPPAQAAAAAAKPTAEELGERLDEAVKIRSLLLKNTQELEGLLQGLGGRYVPPEAGGDLLRDGSGVLPTGRNIHALDPYRMPSPAAMARGSAVAAAILEQHRAANAGAWPETCAVNLWGLDSIKSKGESVGVVLALVGAVPVREGTGRVARFELVPLAELGRPRVDVLCNMSGIFRDSFQNVVELLDDLFARAAAAADEPDHMNYIAKHARAMEQQGLSATSARLFSNPAGDYGSMVNERVGQGSWANGDELGDTWAARNAFSYGRGKERGTARPEVLQALLKSTDRIVQQIDSVEYGLTDIQEYYANTGALKRAAEVAKGDPGPGGRRPRVGCSIVEAFGGAGAGAGGGGGGNAGVPPPRELEEVLRLEYRSKLLNPKWAKAMAAQGSGGAYEISQRMTALVGWGATTDFREGWVWDQAMDTYVGDEEMASKLKKNNPQAFANVLRRMLEAAGRGMWSPDKAQLAALKSMYSELDDQLEGVTGAPPPAGGGGGKAAAQPGKAAGGSRRRR